VQGMIGPVSPGSTYYELSRSSAPFENCSAFLPKTSADYPRLWRGLMPQTRPDKPFVQSDAVRKIELGTARRLAADVGQCLAVQVGEPRTTDFATQDQAR